MSFTLRPYQEAAVAGAELAFRQHRSALVVMATGLGKTVVATALAGRCGGRALLVAHREELVQQARSKLESALGQPCGVEMATERAPVECQAVAASVQTLASPGRLERFTPDAFRLVIVDEAHHATARTWRRVLDHFRSAKVLGMTATPDRTDGRPLGGIFETVAYQYDILNGIEGGWLVPIQQQFVRVRGLDFSRTTIKAGDFDQGELAKVMEIEAHCHAVASATLQYAKGPTILFAVTVRQAEKIAEILNRHRENHAKWICGDLPRTKRRTILAGFEAGECKVVSNVHVLSEGYDGPFVQTIVMARPTLSRLIYTQQIGRALRPLSGLVDGIRGAEARRQQIARSPKPHACVLDLTGNSGRHKLITTADVLGGRDDARVVELAKSIARRASQKGEACDMLAALKEARRRKGIVADAICRVRDVSPFPRSMRILEFADPHAPAVQQWIQDYQSTTT